MAANIISVSSVMFDALITYPSPSPDATNSPTTAPTMANVIEILSAAKKYGSAHGRLIFVNFSLALAPSEVHVLQQLVIDGCKPL